jgi:hypothetical protein
MSGSFAKSTGMVRNQAPTQDMGRLAQITLPRPNRPAEPSYPVERWDSPNLRPIYVRDHRAK